MNQRSLLYVSLLFHAAFLTIYFTQFPKELTAKPEKIKLVTVCDDDSDKISTPKPRKPFL